MMRTASGLLVIAIFAAAFVGRPILNAAHRAWTARWLLEDCREGTAVVATEHLGGKGWHIGYAYSVNGHSYDAIGGGGSDDEAIRVYNARVGERLTVYFSESHPWESSLYRPKQKDLIEALVDLASPFVIIPVVIGVAIWNRKRRRARGVGGGQMSSSYHTTPAHTTTTSWEMRLDAVQSAGDVDPAGDTEIVSVDEATVYQVTGADGRERTYHSLDEMPPKLRAQVERAFTDESRSPRGGHRHPVRGKSVSHESAAPPGQGIDEESLAALDEIPPEMRHQFEKFAAPPKSGEKFTFKFRGPDGREQTFHSLEQLTPEARAIYDRLMHLKTSEAKSDKPKHCSRVTDGE
jgi:hypothetical protein